MTEQASHQDIDTTSDETQPKTQDAVKRRTLITLITIVVLIVWYVAADRLTPFSNQARLKAFVVPVAPEVSGTITEVAVKSNQPVTEGDLLLRIDREQYEIALFKARADLANAEQQISASVSGLDTARAQFAAAKAGEARARKDFERLQRVFNEDPGAISQRRIDTAEASYLEAQSRVAAADSEIIRLQTQIGDTGPDNPTLKAARSALAKAELDMSRTEVRAPARGLIADIVVDTGKFAAAGTPLMTLIAIHDTWIEAALTENNLGHVNPGDEVAVVLDVQPGKVYSGRIRTVGWGVSTNGSSSPGALPTVTNSRDWLRPAQRFPVLIDLDIEGEPGSLGRRVGAQADVLVYTGDNPFMNALGWLYIHLLAYLSYLY